MNTSDSMRRPFEDKRKNTSSSGMLVHIVTDNARTLQDELEEAVRVIRESSRPESRQGILITRHSKALFTVTHSSAVPYGTTMEQDRWHRHSPGNIDEDLSPSIDALS